MVRTSLGQGRGKMSREKMRPSFLIPPDRGLIRVEVLGKCRKDSLVEPDLWGWGYRMNSKEECVCC